MSGLFAYSNRDEAAWMIRNSVFYWMLDRLSQDASERLSSKLREISDNNLGVLWLDELARSEVGELSRLLRELPGIARRELPVTPQREGIALRFEELSALVDADREPP